MKVAIIVLAFVAAAAAGVIPATTLVRAPSHDSAIIQSDRLGGNFAYSTVEGHAYAAVSPVVQNVVSPVAVSYHATPVHTPVNILHQQVVPQYHPTVVIGPQYVPQQIIAPGISAPVIPSIIGAPAPVIPGIVAPTFPIDPTQNLTPVDAAAPVPEEQKPAEEALPIAAENENHQEAAPLADAPVSVEAV